MNTYVKAPPSHTARPKQQPPQRTGTAKPSNQPVNSGPQAGQLMALQKLADTGERSKPPLQMKALAETYSARHPHAMQLKGGSHGKARLLNVQGTYTVGGVATPFNDRGENISIVKGHGGYEDEDALAEQWVRTAYSLAATDTVNITKYNFYTKK